MTNLDNKGQTFSMITLNKTMEMKTKTSDQTIEAVAEAEEAEEEEENSGAGETITEGDEEILRTDLESSEMHLKRE